MNDRKLLGIGVGGTVLAAVCCFTPVLVVLFGAVGLSAWLIWADFVLLPALFVFVGLTFFAAMRLKRSSQETARS